jgi:hypothetical protein
MSDPSTTKSRSCCCKLKNGKPGLPGLPGFAGENGLPGAPGTNGTDFAPTFVNSSISGNQAGVFISNNAIFPFDTVNPETASSSFATFDAKNNAWIIQIPGLYRLTCSIEIQVQQTAPIQYGSYITATDITSGLPGIPTGFPVNVSSIIPDSATTTISHTLFYDSIVNISGPGPQTIAIQYRTPNGNSLRLFAGVALGSDRGSWIIQPINGNSL